MNNKEQDFSNQMYILHQITIYYYKKKKLEN